MKNSFFKDLLLLSFAQFGGAFTFNFTYVFFPFYVRDVSPYSPQETLIWVGMIMGSAGIVFAITAPLWGSLTHRIKPKPLFLFSMATHSVMFVLFGFTTSLPALLVLRILQGLFGGVSTIGLIIISATAPLEKRAFSIGFYQSSLMLGSLLGPPAGAATVAFLGYQGGFLAAAAMLFISFLLSWAYCSNVPVLAKPERGRERSKINSRVMAAWMLLIGVQVQLMFLPSIIPDVFATFGHGKDVALKWAGIIVMLYTASAMAGTYLWTYLTRRISVHRVLALLVPFGVALQALLVLARGTVDFTVGMTLMCGLIAAVGPLVITIFADHPKGSVMGFLNSSRFVGNAAGPFLATTLVAYSNLPTLLLTVGGITLASFIWFRLSFR